MGNCFCSKEFYPCVSHVTWRRLDLTEGTEIRTGLFGVDSRKDSTVLNCNYLFKVVGAQKLKEY